jgi:(p)ppGpp synthase/HD superfamily hydrolase
MTISVATIAHIVETSLCYHYLQYNYAVDGVDQFVDPICLAAAGRPAVDVLDAMRTSYHPPIIDLTPDQIASIRTTLYRAAVAHRGQFRKPRPTDPGLIPFVAHPVTAALYVGLFGGSPTLCIAELLHDVAEDCNIAVAPLVADLPLPDTEKREIVDIVAALTKSMDVTPRIRREQDTIDRVVAAPPGAVLCKMCDRIHNILGIDAFSDRFRLQYLEETDRLIDGMRDRAYACGYREAHTLLVELTDAARTSR